MNGNDIPGVASYPVVYNDGKYAVREGPSLTVYHNTAYTSPLKGTHMRGWLCCGEWKKIGETYVEVDGLGFPTGREVSSVDELVRRKKEERHDK